MQRLCHNVSNDADPAVDESLLEGYVSRLGCNRDAESILKTASRYVTRKLEKNGLVETGRQ